MRCPFCGHDDTQVKDSRPTEDNTSIRRRRACPNCGGRFTTFERKQIGIRLKVKPQINEGNTVRLDIEQSVDGIAAGSAGKSDVVTNQRMITTSVLVDDGAALVLGGLIEDRVIENKQ
ncbi:MAG: hypothetical protein DSY86_02955, partial [Marinomonas sp.]